MLCDALQLRFQRLNVDSSFKLQQFEIVNYIAVGLGHAIVFMLNQLSQHDIDTSSIIGHSYDGAGNMSVEYSGLKTRIQQVQSEALYVVQGTSSQPCN